MNTTAPGPGAPGYDAAADPAAVLADLDPEQREVALAPRGPVCVLAGAGTGKTRAITHRIAYAVHAGIVQPGHVLAVTFTGRAAGEMRARLTRLGGPALGLGQVRAMTFHAAALRQLGYFWAATVGGRPPQVLAAKAGLIAEAAAAAGVQPGADLSDIAAEIEWAKVTQLRPGDYAREAELAGRRPLLGAAATGEIYAAYEDLRRRRHLVDFESVLELTAAILAENGQAAAQVRDRYRCFVVDEYQDVNPLQKMLLDTWLGGRDDLCVVGDPDQAIYSFAGANPGYLTGFAAEFPAATVIRMRRDYRSTPQVVALANRLIAVSDSGQRTSLMPVARWAAALVAQRPPGPPPSLTSYPDEAAEAAGVAARAAELVSGGTRPEQIAILVRINAQANAFEQALREAGIGCQVRSGEQFFSRPEVRQATGLLRAAAKSSAGAARPVPAGPVREGDRGHQARSLAAEVRHVLSGLGLAGPAGPSGPVPSAGPARERWEALAALVWLAEDMSDADPGATLGDLTDEMAGRAAAGHPPVLPGVTLCSLHAAKGLEWDVVFLPGLAEGVLPIVHAQTTTAIAEERRLLYVGITRAMDRLELSWPAARKPSRFLQAVRAGLVSRS